MRPICTSIASHLYVQCVRSVRPVRTICTSSASILYVQSVRSVPGVTAYTRQSVGLPIALPGPGELEGGGERPRAASPDPRRAVGNPIDCPVNSEAPGTLYTHGELEGLLLDGLLELQVVLVGDVQGHLELGDGHLELLLDAGDLGLEPGLGLHDAGIELFDLDGGLLAEGQRRRGETSENRFECGAEHIGAREENKPPGMALRTHSDTMHYFVHNV